jgi:hypothetical protein
MVKREATRDESSSTPTGNRLKTSSTSPPERTPVPRPGSKGRRTVGRQRSSPKNTMKQGAKSPRPAIIDAQGATPRTAPPQAPPKHQTKLSDEDAPTRSDRSHHGHLQASLFDQHRCRTPDGAFRKESDVATPPSSTRGTRGFRPIRGMVVQRGRYLNEAFKKGNDAGSVVLVVASNDQGFPPIPCPQHQPACPSTGSGEQGCQARDRAGG